MAGIAHLLLAAAVLTAWTSRETARPLLNVTTIVEQPPEKPELLPPPPVPTMIKLPPPAELAMPRIELASPPPTAPAAPTAITVPPPSAPVAVQGAGLPNFAGALMSHLGRYKRYPAEAQARRERGVAKVSFVVDRQGHVISSTLVQGSGSAALDRETLELLRRAEPLPAPPSDVPGTQFAFSVPVRFDLQ